MPLHPDKLPAVHTGKVDAWLTSPEFGKLQQFEFYHYHESFIPRTHQEFMPTPPLSISRFSSSLHTATFAWCHLPNDLVQMLRLPLLKKLSLVVVYLSEASLHNITTPVALSWSAC